MTRAPPTQAELVALLARCRDVVDTMPAGLHLYHFEDLSDDRTLRFIGGNPSAAKIIGTPIDALLGRTLDENFPALREMGIPHAYAEVVRTGLPWRTDQLVYGDHRVIEAAFAVQAFRLPGDCLGVVFEDATPRVRAQDDLRMSEARQRALVEALPDTLYRVRSDGSIHDVRRGIPGPGALARRLAAHVTEPLDTGDVRRFELLEDDQDIEVRLVRTSEDELLAIVRDISERKRGERRKDEFISIVSHELRTPLTSIRGALGLIEGGVLGAASAPMQELVTVARSNADRLIRLINDMLDLDKMEAGRMELDTEPLDAMELVDTALDGVRSTAALAGVHLERSGASPLSVFGDRDRLLQVLTNLLSNAVRFSPPQATVTVTMETPSPTRVRFLVHDEGPGVPHDRADDLFRKFTQVGGDGARRRGGTGLGLAISKAIIAQHGGAIGLAPRDEPGATFFFDVPVSAEPPAAGNGGDAGLTSEALFGDLRRAYVASLPAQIETLADWVARGGASPAAKADAQSLAHRLMGTAGTYGLPAVSECARRLDRALKAAPPDDAELDAALRALRLALPRA